MSPRSRLWSYIVLAEILTPVIILVCAAGGTFTALRLEESDAFCAACHTEPEVQYFQQARARSPVTLAAFHAQIDPSKTRQDARCIDCHSGVGTFGRVQGLYQGAHDLLAYLRGAYHAPAVTTNPLADGSCLKCHAVVLPQQVVTRVNSLQNHFHEYLPYWHELDRDAARCADCHTSHTIGLANDNFANNGAVGVVCEECHRALSGNVGR